MRFLDRLINFVFSLVMVVVSVMVLLVIFDFTSSDYINTLINDYIWNPEYETIVLVVSIIVFFSGLKTTIFLSDFKKKKKVPILVTTDNGKVQIASETIESTAKAVAKSHEEVKDVNAKMVNKNKGVNLYLSILVSQDSNIRALTRQIQEEVKNKIHDTTGVLVLNTDIKVKNIVEKNKKNMATNNTQPLVVTENLEKVDNVEANVVETNVVETNVEKENYMNSETSNVQE